jgi:hypothetical protein
MLPDGLLVLGGNTFLAPFLNSRKAMLERNHVAGRSAFAFQSCHFVSSHVADSFSHIGFVVAKQWQSRNILLCSQAVRRATRIASTGVV